MYPYGIAVLDRALTFLGVKETAPNSGPHIDSWLALVGQTPGVSWCAAFAYAMHLAVALDRGMQCPFPRTASALRVWERANDYCRRTAPAPGMTYVLDHGGGLGHVGIVHSVLPDSRIMDVSGNTNAAGSRQGDRVALHGPWQPQDGKRGRLLGYLDWEAALAPAVA